MKWLIIHIGLLVAIAAFLSSCQSSRPVIVYESPPVIYPQEVQAPQVQSSEGSLFTPVASSWSPWCDDTARIVGDIVTVRVSVDNEAENTATTDLSRASEAQYAIPSLLGNETNFPGVKDTSNNTTADQLIKASSTNNFQGDGGTKRSGKMTADVSAVILQVFANGNMRIHGSQSLLINAENSILTVDGVIRPSDITVDNIVASNRIANARIEVTGKGVVTDKQRPGFLSRVIDWFWPM